MTRSDALRDLIAQVERAADSTEVWQSRIEDAGLRYQDVWGAAGGSLDAVARLEAPLRERGWWGPMCHPGTSFEPDYRAHLWFAEPTRGSDIDNSDAEGRAPTEPRARLLAFLRAMLHEAEQEARHDD